jgi:hypothetical protein
MLQPRTTGQGAQVGQNSVNLVTPARNGTIDPLTRQKK